MKLLKHCSKVFKFLSLMTLLLPTIIFAQTSGNPPGTTPSGNGLSYSLKNPISDFPDLQSLVVAIINIIIIIATPIVIFFIIFAGFSYVTARGNPAKIQEATRSLTYAVIGGVLIIGAFAIAEIIKNLVNSFAS